MGVGRNPQEMAIEAEGREDVDISSTRRWPEASADDGKRALAQLEVDASPLRATKGGVWGGISPGHAGRRQGSVDFWGSWTLFSLLWRIFSICLHILSYLAFLSGFFGFLE